MAVLSQEHVRQVVSCSYYVTILSNIFCKEAKGIQGDHDDWGKTLFEQTAVQHVVIQT